MKNKNIFLANVVLIVLSMFLIMISCIRFKANVVVEEEAEEESTEVEEEVLEIELDSKLADTLLNDINLTLNCTDYCIQIYNDNFDSKAKAYITLNYLNEEKVSVDELNKNLDKIFNVSLNTYIDLENYSYDNDYYFKNKAANANNSMFKVISINKYSNYIEVLGYVLFYSVNSDGTYNFYTDVEMTDVLDESANIEDVDNYYENSSIYSYTFKLEDNNYYLDKIEIQK
jgi:hypothetical protein